MKALALALCFLLSLSLSAHAWDEGTSNAAIISKTTAVTIGPAAAKTVYFNGLLIHTALTGTCVLTGFADSDGTAQSYTLPAGSVGFKDFHDALNSAGALTITCSNAADDNLVMVFWRPNQ